MAAVSRSVKPNLVLVMWSVRRMRLLRRGLEATVAFSWRQGPSGAVFMGRILNVCLRTGVIFPSPTRLPMRRPGSSLSSLFQLACSRVCRGEIAAREALEAGPC